MPELQTWFSSFIFWGAWIIIPFIMELVPSFGSAIMLMKKRIKNHVPPTPAADPEITLIIPVYNSSDSLYGCIKSVNDSTYDNDKMRIFLVNNHTQDDSFKVYTRAQKDFPELRMQWLNAEQGKSRALNLALYNSTGKYIINIDSDGMLEKTALQNMVYTFEEDQSIGCMTGAILTIPEQIEEYKNFFSKLLRRVEFVEYAQAFLAGRSYASEKGEVYTLSGAFSAFKKSAVLKSRMYDTFTIAEDTQITFQMKYLQHQKVKMCDAALYLVGPIEGVNKLYTQRQRWQRGSLEVAKLFDSKDFRPGRILKDVNVRTLMYDHTFAFPRMIWYLALICLAVMGYAVKMIAFSTIFMMVSYVIISYLYYISIYIFMNKFPSLQRYYKKQWWVVSLLPLFNAVLFFVRMAGILNSINTTSAWKTLTLTDEWSSFIKSLKEELKRSTAWVGKLRKAVNVDEEKA
ncbi:MAG: putative glycosyltransferase, exosortase G system-associated [Lachnospiraceae bacterium]|nr:putative glycosyltransferase, exosortase G system-associated [Lachnospiraceae bacterium]